MHYEIKRLIQPYPCAQSGAEFTPQAPEVPQGKQAEWRLRGVMLLEPGWVMCTWELLDDPTVEEALGNARETITALYQVLREKFPEESDHPGYDFVDEIIARTLVALGWRKRLIPQHLTKYVEDMDGEW